MSARPVFHGVTAFTMDTSSGDLETADMPIGDGHMRAVGWPGLLAWLPSPRAGIDARFAAIPIREPRRIRHDQLSNAPVSERVA